MIHSSELNSCKMGHQLRHEQRQILQFHIHRTISGVATLPLGLLHSACSGTRVNLCRFPDNKTILHQFPDVLPCTRHSFISLDATINQNQQQENLNHFDCISYQH